MHSYLRSVGFSNIKKREDLEQILGMVMAQPTEKYVTSERKNYVEAELVKDFSDRLGLQYVGNMMKKDFSSRALLSIL